MSDSDDSGVVRRQRSKIGKRKAAVVESEDEAEADFNSSAAAATVPLDDDDDIEIARYDAEGYGDDEDRAALDAMPEVQREALIFERLEARQAAEERRDAKRRAEAAAAAEAEESQPSRKATRGASAAKRGSKSAKSDKQAALEDLTARRSKPKSSRRTEIDEDQEDDEAAADEFDDEEEYDEDSESSDRARSSKRRKTESTRRSRRSDRESQSVSDADEDDFIENDDDESMAADELDSEDEARAARDAEEARRVAAIRTPLRVEDMVSIQLRRTAIQSLVDEVWFARFAQNMFARIPGADNRKNEEVRYMVVRIIDIVDHKSSKSSTVAESTSQQIVPYRLMNKKLCYVDAVVQAPSGHEKTIQLDTISNHSITESEFNSYRAKRQTEDDRRVKAGADPLPPLMSREEAATKRRNALQLQTSYVYTHADTELKIQQNKQRSKATVNKSALKIELGIQINKLQSEIRLRGPTSGSRWTDVELADAQRELAAVQAQLAELTEHDRGGGASSSSSGGGSTAAGSQSSIHALNSRNKQRDLEMHRDVDAFERERAEKIKQQLEAAAAAGQSSQQISESLEALESVDAFKRRATRPMMNVVDDDDGDEDDDKTRKAKAEAAKAAKDSAERAAKEAAMEAKRKAAADKKKALQITARKVAADVDGDDVMSPASDAQTSNSFQQLTVVSPAANASLQQPIHVSAANGLIANLIRSIHQIATVHVDSSVLDRPLLSSSHPRPYRLLFQPRYMTKASGFDREISVEDYWYDREKAEADQAAAAAATAH